MNLKYLFKQLITGTLFAIFGLICMLGNMLFIPIVVFKLNKLKFIQNFARDTVWFSWKIFIEITRVFGYLDYKYKIKTKLGKNAQMIIANHPSLLDVVFLISRVRRANCVVKGELEKNIFLFAAIKACNYIPNTQNEELLQKAVDALKKGESLIIFPEGTRTKDEIIFHKAAAYMAVKGAGEIIAIAINMHPRSLRKKEPWYKTPDVVIKYEFKELFSINLEDFQGQKPDPIRARELHLYMSEIYKEEFKDAKFNQ